MLSEYKNLVEAEQILNRLQYEVWKETQGFAWQLIVHALAYIRRQERELFHD